MGVFHEGERTVQSRAGVGREAKDLGRGISRALPAGAAPFLAGQRLAVLAGVDDADRIWASLATGEPGFITSPDESTLRLAARLPAVDPIREGLAAGRSVGVLVLDPERRRRIRVNGRSVGVDSGAVGGANGGAGGEAIEIRVEEVFGNCPKYIQARAPEGAAVHHRPEGARRSRVLSATQRAAIERADTFFIASRHAQAGADASHRGGQPGFLRVDDPRTLRFPDYAGNNMFQTLGNITADPRVGLLFVDFDTGVTIQLTGRARVLWDPAEFADMAGAQRAVVVEVDEVVEIDGRGPLGWRFVESSPFNPT